MLNIQYSRRGWSELGILINIQYRIWMQKKILTFFYFLLYNIILPSVLCCYANNSKRHFEGEPTQPNFKQPRTVVPYVARHFVQLTAFLIRLCWIREHNNNTYDCGQGSVDVPNQSLPNPTGIILTGHNQPLFYQGGSSHCLDWFFSVNLKPVLNEILGT